MKKLIETLRRVFPFGIERSDVFWFFITFFVASYVFKMIL